MNERKVLDQGYVRLVEFMGGDRAVVQSARVSTGQGLKGDKADKKLVGYLLANHHGTPFEQAVFKFHVKLPIFVMRQWIRHRMSSYNEISARYTEMPDEFYIPEKWRAQSKRNKQGSHSADLEHYKLSCQLERACARSYEEYESFIKDGVAKEMARLVLPINIYTQFYWTVNARALMHFFGLRSEAHAQWEIRQYSNALFFFFRDAMPWTAEAWLQTIDRKSYTAEAGEVAGPHMPQQIAGAK